VPTIELLADIAALKNKVDELRDLIKKKDEALVAHLEYEYGNGNLYGEIQNTRDITKKALALKEGEG